MCLFSNFYFYYMWIRYKKCTSKNYQVYLEHYSNEYFKTLVIYYQKDSMRSWSTYNEHLEEDMKDGLLFSTPIKNLTSNIRYKKGARVDIHTISHWLENIVKDVGIQGKLTNKTSKQIVITRMLVANVLYEVMC